MQIGAKGVEPSVYAMGEAAYKWVKRHRTPAALVMSGESGAGKTEETKLCLQYLASVAGGSSEGQVGKEQLLLQSSPILESFGNAKTVRNNNSSRFGKYLQVKFSKGMKIIGGQTTKYLLEKSRVIALGPGERNYHVFYQVFCLPTPPSRFNFRGQQSELNGMSIEMNDATGNGAGQGRAGPIV